MAFVAVGSSTNGADEMVGEVRMFSYSNEATAEFAILVRSDMKRQGLGRALLQKMIAYSKTSGAEELIGRIRLENQAMIALARCCGMTVEAQPGINIVVAHLDLRPKQAKRALLF